jgi:peptidyl-tRNA hydrolase
MSRRPAAITQADVARIVKAARQAGAPRVTVKVGDAEVVIELRETAEIVPLPSRAPVAPKRRIAL